MDDDPYQSLKSSPQKTNVDWHKGNSVHAINLGFSPSMKFDDDGATTGVTSNNNKKMSYNRATQSTSPAFRDTRVKFLN